VSELLNSLAQGTLKRADMLRFAALASTLHEQTSHAERLPSEPAQTLEALPEYASSVGLDELASTVWRHRNLLFAFGSAGLAIAILASLFSTTIYRARTAIRLQIPPDPYATVSTQSPSSEGEEVSTSESYVQNEIKVLQSDSLAERVADRLDAQFRPGREKLRISSPLQKILTHLMRRERPSPEQARILSIHRVVNIHTSLKSQVVEIYFDSTDPIRAAAGANAVVSEYISMNKDAQTKSAQDRTEWLSSQISDLKTKLDRENQELKAFASAAGLIYSANQGALAEQRVSEIQSQLTRAEADRAAMQSRYETALSDAPDSTPKGTNDALLEGASDPLLHEYQTNLVAAEKELGTLRSVYTQENYKVADAEARVAQIQASIQRERYSLLDRLRTKYQSTVSLQSSIESAYRAQTQKLQSQSADVFRYNTLKHDLDTTQHLYDSLLQKIKEAEIASSLKTTNVRLIDPARPPTTPYSPNRPMDGAIGSGLGILVGLLTILIHSRGAVPRGVNAQSMLPLLRELGSIPDASSIPGISETHSLALAWNQPTPPTLEMTTWDAHGPLTEAYSSIISSILFSPRCASKHRALAVTSVDPQEGKTTIITTIAMMLAECHDRVLLIDADLRRPSLHRVFDQCNDTGLTSLLAKDKSITSDELVHFYRRTQFTGLYLLPSGPGVPSITPLLRSPRIADLLALARHDFDWVLIDTPPTSLFFDARALGRLSDSVILVFDEQRARCDALTATCRQFTEDGTNILGTIRNRADLRHGRRAYEYYKSYHTA